VAASFSEVTMHDMDSRACRISPILRDPETVWAGIRVANAHLDVRLGYAVRWFIGPCCRGDAIGGPRVHQGDRRKHSVLANTIS